MRSIAWLCAGVLAVSGCRDRELELAAQIVVAEEAEASARRELVRLERQRETAGSTPTLEAELAAQHERVRAAEIKARSLRIQRNQ